VDIVVDFLDAYFEAQEDLVRQGPALADEYKKFLMDYSALEISDDNARGDFEDIIFYSIEEHIENLENGNFEKWTKESADFFYEKGRFTKEDRDKLEELRFGYTDKFMKLVAKKRGIIN
ncbi:MAG: hypothetical protein PHS21_09720, partial [Atribacterota bacterium]|nr:hypothetical protein [Atribacterota bacterium]